MAAPKVRAFLGLTDRKRRGEAVDAKDGRKHRHDAFRLLQLVPEDAARFADMVRADQPDLRSLGLVLGDIEEALSVLPALRGPAS